MTIVSSHVEAAMGVLAEHAKELGFGEITLWCHVDTEGHTDWSIFARESVDCIDSKMFCGKTFEEALHKTQEFINNRKNAEVLLSL